MEMTPHELKLARKKQGWSVEQAAEGYGKYTRGTPVAAVAIYKMEEIVIPKDEKRRWILSRMYNIAPSLLGLSMMPRPEPPSLSKDSRPVDVKEYQKTLLTYWKKGYKGNAQTALDDLALRINALHHALPYTAEQDPLYRLLCGYLMTRAEVTNGTGHSREALEHLNKAVIVATTRNYADLSATTLYRRGEFHFQRWELGKALADFSQAEKFQQAPPDILGRVKSMKGATLARMARSEREMAEAMRVVNLTRSLIRTEAQEPSCLIDFPQAQFTTRYIQSLLGSSVRKLHRPNEADGLIIDAYRKTKMPNLYANEKISNLLLSAQISLDQGYHPVAASQLGDALQLIQKDRLLYLPFAEQIYEGLSSDNMYSKEKEVAELGLQLLFVQIPHLLD